MTIGAADRGTGATTVAFVRSLREQYALKRLLIRWDKATYHVGAEMVRYLSEVNGGRARNEWLVTCWTFAPNAPDQNPMEDVWLQAKQYVRKHWHLCDQFAVVKQLFLQATPNQSFDFPKLHMYD